MKKILENLYCYQDTCNVYVIRNGNEGILIDFGSGDILDQLHTIGIDRITDVLMTHQHRDQGQGLARAMEHHIRIWVPHTEQDLFHDVDQHWQAREIYNNYNVRQDKFSILEPVRVAGTLRDYAFYQFGSSVIQVVPTPGHTAGSVSFLVELEGKKVILTGDLIYGPGKVWSLAATQWNYNGCQGIVTGILSLLSIKEKLPSLLLPSHGEPMEEPISAIDLVVDRYQRLLQLRNQFTNLLELRKNPFEQLTPHLLLNKTSFSNSYVLLSESGKALIVDYGYDFTLSFAAGADRASRRPWLYTIDVLKRDYGINKIDVALVTHYHDDHVAGLNLLRDVEGAQIWAAETFSELLEEPSKFDVPCLWYDPIPVDRKLSLQVPVTWEEYEITLYPQPGHTLYAAAIYFEVDGKRVLAIGDQQANDGYIWNYVYKNRFKMEDYKESASLYLQLKPDLILSGHWEPLWVEEEYLEKLKDKGELLEQLHHELLPLEDIHLGAEGVCSWIQPYQAIVENGKSVNLDVEVLNPLNYEENIFLQLIVPHGWAVINNDRYVRLQPQATETISFEIRVPEGIKMRRARIAVDVTAGQIKLGQQAESLVTVI